MAKKEKKGKPASEGEVEKYPDGYKPRLVARYMERIAPAMREKFQYTNPMTVPRLEKVVVNMGLGDAVANPKIIDGAREDLRLITGQQPIVRRARKSIASFKLREGLPIGLKVTLRRFRMWEFVDRFLNIALPRMRDFRGVSAKGFDGAGNYAVGIKEQIIFPEIDYDKVDAIRGMNIVFVTSARTNDEGRELLRLLGMPFRGLPIEL
jgi:large subunit ribosomal protein L5